MSGPLACPYVTVDCLTVPRRAVPPPALLGNYATGAFNSVGPTELTDALLALNPANTSAIPSSTSIRIKHNTSLVSVPTFRLSGKQGVGETISEAQLTKPAHHRSLPPVTGSDQGSFPRGSAVLQYNTPTMLPGGTGGSSAAWNAMPYPNSGMQNAHAPFSGWPRFAGPVFQAFGTSRPALSDGCASPRAASPDRESVEAARQQSWQLLGQSNGAPPAVGADEAYLGAMADARTNTIASAMYYAAHYPHPMASASAGFAFAHPAFVSSTFIDAQAPVSLPQPNWPIKQEVRTYSQSLSPGLRPQSTLKRSRDGHDVDAAGSDPETTFRCNIPGCGAVFRRRYDLSVHSRVHTNERPFPCTMPGCSAAFKTAGACVAHVRTHTGERPFRCPYPNCHARFGQKSSCNRHVRLRHADWSGTYNGPAR